MNRPDGVFPASGRKRDNMFQSSRLAGLQFCCPEVFSFSVEPYDRVPSAFASGHL